MRICVQCRQHNARLADGHLRDARMCPLSAFDIQRARARTLCASEPPAGNWQFVISCPQTSTLRNATQRCATLRNTATGSEPLLLLLSAPCDLRVSDD